MRTVLLEGFYHALGCWQSAADPDALLEFLLELLLGTLCRRSTGPHHRSELTNPTFTSLVRRWQKQQRCKAMDIPIPFTWKPSPSAIRLRSKPYPTGTGIFASLSPSSFLRGLAKTELETDRPGGAQLGNANPALYRKIRCTNLVVRTPDVTRVAKQDSRMDLSLPTGHRNNAHVTHHPTVCRQGGTARSRCCPCNGGPACSAQ